jgi:hypothetical protein
MEIKQKRKKEIGGINYYTIISHNPRKMEYKTFEVEFYAMIGMIVKGPLKRDLKHLNKVFNFVCESVEEYVKEHRVSYLRFKGVRSYKDEESKNGILTKALIRYISRRYNKDCIMFPEGKPGDVVYVNTKKCFPKIINEPDNYLKTSGLIASFKTDEEEPVKPYLSYDGYHIEYKINGVDLNIVLNDLTRKYSVEIKDGGEDFKSYEMNSFEEMYKTIETTLLNHISS